MDSKIPSKIFDLPRSISELPPTNGGMSRMHYNQQQSQRGVRGADFPQGQINIIWNVDGNQHWIPNKSYMRIRGRLSKAVVPPAAPVPLTLSDQISPNMGVCGNLFQSMEFKINDKTITKIDNYVPQIDSLENRLNKSGEWLRGIGQSLNMWESSQALRSSLFSSDGVQLNYPQAAQSIITTRVGCGFDAATNTLAWTTANSTFTFAQAGGAALPNPIGGIGGVFPPGSYITILASVQVPAFVNVPLLVTGGGATTVIVTTLRPVQADSAAAEAMNFNRTVSTAVIANPLQQARYCQYEFVWQPPLSIFKVEHALPAGKYELVLNPQTSTAFQTYAIESVSAAAAPGVNFNFEVSDMYLYCAMVDGPQVKDMEYLLDLHETRVQPINLTSVDYQQQLFTVSPSSYALTAAFQDPRVGSRPDLSSSKFKCLAGDDLKLTRFSINYAGQTRPDPDSDLRFNIDTPLNQEFTVQRYNESAINCGMLTSDGGPETLTEWQQRGPFYHFAWPRDGYDKSTQARVNFAFSTPAGGAAPSSANIRVLLFDHYRKVAKITIRDSRVVDVRVQEV